MALSRNIVSAVPLPRECSVIDHYPRTDLADAYSIELPPGVSQSPEELARFMFAHAPGWSRALMGLRDLLVAGLGLKTVAQLTATTPEQAAQRIAFFKIYSRRAGEIVLGEDDKHLDFRLSLLCPPAPRGRRLTVSTVVHCHNRLGRGYLFVIAPFHRPIVRAYLRRAARVGWPGATPG
ncbi:DUF2867 domain-containing protein [Lysobacter firmicutimachus]|uniref:DUF2867 domain-containing protein n=1 Tax=Lysobacter firmicutimachus TaxID=1792846 RepID=A0ABU8D2P5_9GAMM